MIKMNLNFNPDSPIYGSYGVYARINELKLQGRGGNPFE